MWIFEQLWRKTDSATIEIRIFRVESMIVTVRPDRIGSDSIIIIIIIFLRNNSFYTGIANGGITGSILLFK